MYGGCTRRRKELFFIAGKRWPDRDTMSPIKEPCRVGTISTSGIIFLGNGWPTLKARATGPLMRSRARLAFFPPGPGDRLRLILKIKFVPAVPTRQSDRQVADAPCNRRLVPRPYPGFACEAGASSGLPVPFKGGRSATRRVVSVGMLVHPRKRTKHGWRVPWPSGPREHRFRVRR